jgi:hypothetical protein
MTDYWEQAWSQTIAEQSAKTTVDQAKWKASGRVTKANPNKEDGTWWQTNGPKMLESWITWRNAEHPWVLWEPSPGQPAIELGLTPVWNDVPVQMHIDRVMVNPDGELVVIDLKTGARTPMSDLQLAFYAAGMEAIFGIRPTYGAYWMARSGGIKELVDLSVYSTDTIIELVTKFDAARKAEIFLPNLSHCIMCSVRSECKWNKKGMEEEVNE